MDTRTLLVEAALTVLEEDGEAQFTTRAVCAIAKVTAPTLYHHFGTADGLLSAAMTEAFTQLLASKKAVIQSPEPETALREGWDDYVRFAAARPKLYAAMMSRVLQGGKIPAAEQGFAHLVGQIMAVDAEGRLTVSPNVASDLVWASANAAALLYVTAQVRGTAPPRLAAVHSLRDMAMATILTLQENANTL